MDWIRFLFTLCARADVHWKKKKKKPQAGIGLSKSIPQSPSFWEKKIHHQDYRNTSLISPTGKILLRVILNRLKAKAEELLAEEQAGAQ